MNRDQLAHYAVARSLFSAKNLNRAIDTFGYVQADPIRAPARAQDLILRHRVSGYQCDDLEKKYSRLDIFEDMLHNYGFFPNRHLSLLYPRKLSGRWQRFMAEHATLRRKVLRYLNDNESVHPRDVERAISVGARVNGWGGESAATTLMLEGLHREGRARVTRRDAGIRVYATNPSSETKSLSLMQRADGVIRLFINLYAPIPHRTLTQLITMMGTFKQNLDYVKRIELMVTRGELMRAEIDGLNYVWPAAESTDAVADTSVRLLAPFDPIVWDRRRFEHLWGWAYRFEAYTPPAKRKLGYYALPLLWQSQVIGWANAKVDAGRLKIDFGFVEAKPKARGFVNALDEEVERFREFLRCYV
jgi:uncharacterized protein